MSIERITYLMRNYYEGQLNPEEAAELENMLLDPENSQEIRKLLQRIAEHFPVQRHLSPTTLDAMMDRILTKPEVQEPFRTKVVSFKKRKMWAAAAAILLLGSLAGYYLISWKNVSPATAALADMKPGIPPGGNKATLTLANGTVIRLDTARIGGLASGEANGLVKKDNGLLACAPAAVANGQPSAVQFNTLATPRGGQYQLLLPDGSKVWLNAASSIRYPTVFTGGERKVTVTGEAYFDIAPDPLHPFMVTTRHTDITVLGTRFNIMAYEDEPAVETTLLDGAVKISIPNQPATKILSPGEQASVSNTDENITVRKINAQDAAAWIHGLLSLKNSSVPELMHQLSRWYDVDVEYTGRIPDGSYEGMIDRNTNLSDVLSVLDASGIHTRLQGKKIIVLSN